MGAFAGRAADYTVTTSADEGPGSLRAAVMAAGDGSRIVFDEGVRSITLATSNIVIRSAITITGNDVVISGAGAMRIFHVLASNNDDVTLSGLILTNGVAAVAGGGAIYAQQGARLTLTNCVVAACRATTGQSGGGIHNTGTLLETVDCRFVANHAAANGSALSINVSPPEGLLAVRCTFAGNANTSTSSSNGGGAVIGANGAFTLRDCVFTNNTSSGWGGALYVGGGADDAVIQGCVFEGNYAAQGGALGSRGFYTVNGCTFRRNRCSAGGGAHAQYGGGYRFLNSLFEQNDSTNSANWSCGGAVYARGAPTYLFSNCVFRANRDINNAGTTGYGGAVGSFSDAGVGTYWNCLFLDNESGLGGGAVWMRHPALFHGCTFAGNYAKDDGGAFHSQEGWKRFENCTFSGNRTAGSTGNWGGAVYLNTLTNHWFDQCTIVSNSGHYGGIYVNNTNNNVYLHGTLVAHNTDLVGARVDDLQGTIREMRHCLVTEAASGYTLADASPVGNLPAGTDPELTPLADHGGPVLPGGYALLTHALSAGSPAINAGWNRLGFLYDQRGPGHPREQPAGSPDIGAFECRASLPAGTLLKIR